MFSSQYTDTLDDKGRLLIPPRWRKELGASAVITRGLDPCLFVFPSKKFRHLAREIEKLGMAKSDARVLSRSLFGEAVDNTLDRQGRIELNPALREFAGIADEAVIVGVNDRIEIWNPERYAELDKKTEAEVGVVSERIGDALQAARAAAR